MQSDLVMVSNFRFAGCAMDSFGWAGMQSVDQLDVADEERVNDLLCQWHQWSAGYEFGHGFASSSSMFRQARSSRQYDDANGSLDAHVDAVLMEAVDAVMSGIPQPYYTALAILARNLSTGRSVWTSPRLPSDQAERVRLVTHARKLFAAALARADLI